MAVGRGRSTTPFIAAGADHFREASAPCSSALWLTPRLSAAQSLGKEDARLQKKKCGQFHLRPEDDNPVHFNSICFLLLLLLFLRDFVRRGFSPAPLRQLVNDPPPHEAVAHRFSIAARSVGATTFVRGCVCAGVVARGVGKLGAGRWRGKCEVVSCRARNKQTHARQNLVRRHWTNLMQTESKTRGERRRRGRGQLVGRRTVGADACDGEVTLL
eukprot:COSAG06_NODE_4232_length_4446_cov_9.610076_4_plen_215_part_00